MSNCGTVKIKLKTKNSKVKLCVKITPLSVVTNGLDYSLDFTL